jgi:carbon-monoxide dehydrogenase medium subunit
LRARQAEEILRGKPLDPGIVAEAAHRAAEESDPVGDLDGSAEYKRKMVEVFVQRALRQASQAARGRE